MTCTIGDSGGDRARSGGRQTEESKADGGITVVLVSGKSNGRSTHPSLPTGKENL